MQELAESGSRNACACQWRKTVTGGTYSSGKGLGCKELQVHHRLVFR